MALSPIEDVVADVRAGRMVVIVDDEDRENEGDLVIAAEAATPEAINFMARFGRGLVCLTLTAERCRQLDLPQMVRRNGSPHGTAFTVSIEAAEGVTTGISAADRAHTIRVVVARNATARDIVQPGHVFPLMAQDGGVLVRAGHTEAGCDLARLAGFEPAAVICEILCEDGTMARLPELAGFAATHGLKIGAIRDLIQHRSVGECLVRRLLEHDFIGSHGAFRLYAYDDLVNDVIHFALVKGRIRADAQTLVRVHQPLCSLDGFDFAEQPYSFSLGQAADLIEQAGAGVLVILHRKETKAEMLELIDCARRGVPRAAGWNARLFGIGAQILKDLGVGRMRIIGSPQKIPSVGGFGLEIVGYEDPNASSRKEIAGHRP
ncbi:bifunctional 3,4-dihydroxy-2-butanone-4-phosphate synthase/GTP cyclohydrolase II [Thauera sinica]|uniref:3,4-dihydroxy-2-butanone 4-phosphate synthase n=2 Tax=Thauera TaxID=33057 RepID=A0ABW1AXA3_9RHOO